MKKGFYIFRENKEQNINLGTRILCDGEDLFIVRYKPSRKKYYLCNFNLGYFGTIIPVERILDNAREAILSNSDLITYCGDSITYTERYRNFTTRQFYSREVTLTWINDKLSFVTGEEKNICQFEYYKFYNVINAI